VRAVAPGQVAVLYVGDRVVGGATIQRALHRTTSTEGSFEGAVP
jgi:hypothetical protein